MRKPTIRPNVLMAIASVVTMCLAIASSRGHAYQSNDLNGTSWQLMRVQLPDETTLVPGDRSKYTISFGSDGAVSARVDCNRGRSTWRTDGPNQLRFGSWSMTRAKCPAGSLHDRIVKEGGSVRSYSLKNGRLFLTSADGSYYELEPLGVRKD